jgi:MFS family permease
LDDLSRLAVPAIRIQTPRFRALGEINNLWRKRVNDNAQRWLGVTTLFIVVAIGYIDRINIAMLINDNDFLTQMGIGISDRTSQGLLATMFMMGYGLSAFLFTPLCEAAFGVRYSLLYGLAFWGIITVITPFFHDFGMLLFSRFVLGLSEGPLFSLASSYIKARFGGEQNGKPTAFLSMGSGVGLTIGYPLIGLFLSTIGWEGSFFALGTLNLILGVPIILAFIHMPPRRSAAGDKALTLRQAIAGVPLMIRGALQTRHILLMTTITTMTLAYLWGSGNWLPAYLKQARGFSLQEMGYLAALPQLASIVSIFLGGALLDRLQRRNAPAIFVFGGLCVALSVLVAINATDNHVSAYWLIAANFFWGLQYPTVLALFQYFSKQEYTASACGVGVGTAALVSGLMPAFMGWVIAVVTANGDIAMGFYAGFALLMGTQVISILCALAVWARERAFKKASFSTA